jgi:hypothetical protein
MGVLTMSDIVAANGMLVLILGFVLLALVAVLTPLVVAVLQWRLVRQSEIEASLQKAEWDAALKREMLERGMSAADIGQVLESHTSAASGSSASSEAFIKDKLGEKDWRAIGRKWAAFGRMWGAGAKSKHRGCNS